MALVEHDAVTHNAHLGVAADGAVLHIAARNSARARDLEHLAHLGVAEHDFLELGLEHALHGLLHLLDAVVDDAVHAHIHALLMRGVGRRAVRTHVEADDDRARSGSQHDVGLVDRADCAVDDLDAHLVVRELLERRAQRLDRALYVRLDDDVQFLHLALLNGGEQVVERDLVEQLVALFLLLVLALLDQLARHLLVVYRVEDVARARHLGQTDDLNRDRRAGLLDLSAIVVGHGAHAADRRARDNRIAGMQRAVLHEQGRNRAAALIQLGLDDRAVRLAVRVGLEVGHFRSQQHHFEQVLDALTELGRDLADDRVAAPLLGHDLVLGQLLEHAVRVRARLVDLVDRHDDRHVRRLGVVDRLDGLRHDAVVRRDDKDRDIRDLRAARTHGGERRMARGIEEGDLLVVYLDAVRTDVLGDAAGLALGDLGLADRVEQRGLAVVNVAHNDNDRIARLEVLLAVLALVKQLLLDGDMDFLFDLAAHLLRDDRGGVEVDDLGNRRHDAQLDQALDDVRRSALHAAGQLADRDLVRDHNLDRDLLERGHLLLALQALHLLLLLLAALVAKGLGALLGLLGQLLLLGAAGLHALGLGINQLVDVVVVLGEVDVARAAGVDAVHLLDLALHRLGGLFRLGLLCRLRGLILLLRGRRSGGLCVLRRLLGRLAGRHLRVQGLLDIRHLMMLGHILENDGQLLISQHLHVVFRGGAVFGQDLRDLLGRGAEVFRDLVHTVFILYCHRQLLLSEFRSKACFRPTRVKITAWLRCAGISYLRRALRAGFPWACAGFSQGLLPLQQVQPAQVSPWASFCPCGTGCARSSRQAARPPRRMRCASTRAFAWPRPQGRCR